MSSDGRYESKVALVTGGAAGIGRACCERLASEGASLAIVDRDIEGAQALAAGLDQQGAKAIAIQADVSDKASAANAVSQTADHFGRLDLVVNNAGIGGTKDTWQDTADELWDRTIGINLSGVFYVMRAAYDPLVASGGGAIVNISSILGTVGFINAAAYVAAKHGVIGLTKSAALSWGSVDIRVTAVCPTFIRTALTDTIDETAWDALLTRHPLGRVPDPEDVAAMVAFLGSDDARSITGSTHFVDAGYTAG